MSGIVLEALAQRTLLVTNVDDTGAGSLRQAIMDASPGDTISIDESLLGQTITLTSGALLLDKNIAITGPGTPFVDNANFVEVHAGGASRVIEIQQGIVAMISSLDISGGYSDADGGGMYVGEDAVVTLEHLAFFNNTALDNGGAIYNSGGAEIIARWVTIEKNAALGELSPNGGGLYNASGFVLLEASALIENESARGGGIWNTGNGVVTLNGTLVRANKAELEGGGIYNNHKMIIQNSTIAENQAVVEAGGIRNRSSDSLLIVNSTISSNQAAQTGGVYNFRGSKVYIYNSTIVANESDEEGSGLFNEQDGSISLYSSIVASNKRSNATPSDVLDESGGGIISEGFNIIGARGALNLLTTDQSGTVSTPFNPQLEELMQNGSSAFIHLPRSNSLAIDRGECQRIPLFLDQSGFLRVIDVPEVDNASDGCDVGSVEYSSAINVANEEGQEIPRKNGLSRAYPNPFSSSATFKVHVEKDQHVLIELFDMLGRRVQVIHEGLLQGGMPHSFNIIPSSGLSNGIYFYQIRGETLNGTQSVIYRN